MKKTTILTIFTSMFGTLAVISAYHLSRNIVICDIYLPCQVSLIAYIAPVLMFIVFTVLLFQLDKEEND